MRYDGDSLTVEVADTPETRAEGLADRDSLAHDSGMLFDLVEGDAVSCLGPLGRPYLPVDPPADAWMVAGGVGLAPFVTLGSARRERRNSEKLTLRGGKPT